MTELIDPISGGDRFVLLLVSVVMLTTTLIPVGVVGFIQWRKVREHEATSGLIHDMLARSFTSEEIERVLTGTELDARSANSIITQAKASFACRTLP